MCSPSWPAESIPPRPSPGESFPVSATVFREGHGMLGAGAVLRGPDGRRRPLVPMRELAPGTDRYGAVVTVTSEGLWHFEVEAWGDPHRPVAARRGHQGAARPGRGADAGRRRAALRPRGRPGPRLPRSAGTRTSADAAAARAALGALAATLRDTGHPRPGPPRRGQSRGDHRGPRRVPAAGSAHPVRQVPGDRAQGARALRLLVRVLPPVGGGHRRRGPRASARSRGRCVRPPGGWTPSPGWASTWSTSRRCTRSGSPPGRGRTTR